MQHAAPVRPGERIYFRPDDPAPGDTVRIAALVLGPRMAHAAADPVRIVVTEAHVVSRDARLVPNAVLRIRREQIVVHEVDDDPALLQATTVAGRLVGWRRVDGRTAPVRVVTVELDASGEAIHHGVVDHTGSRMPTREKEPVPPAHRSP